MAAAITGYRMILVMPEHMSVERRAVMRAFGAEIVLTPAAGSMEARHRSGQRHGGARGRGVRLDQFSNPDNPLAHYETTGPEIWRDTAGRVTHFVSAMGTTGTIMGTGRYLKEQNPAVQIVGVQPEEGSNIPGHPPLAARPICRGSTTAARVDRIIDVSQAEAETDHARPGGAGGDLRRGLLRRGRGGGPAPVARGQRRRDRGHRLRPRRPLPVHRRLPRTRACHLRMSERPLGDQRISLSTETPPETPRGRDRVPHPRWPRPDPFDGKAVFVQAPCPGSGCRCAIRGCSALRRGGGHPGPARLARAGGAALPALRRLRRVQPAAPGPRPRSA